LLHAVYMYEVLFIIGCLMLATCELACCNDSFWVEFEGV